MCVWKGDNPLGRLDHTGSPLISSLTAERGRHTRFVDHNLSHWNVHLLQAAQLTTGSWLMA